MTVAKQWNGFSRWNCRAQSFQHIRERFPLSQARLSLNAHDLHIQWIFALGTLPSIGDFRRFVAPMSWILRKMLSMSKLADSLWGDPNGS